MLALLALTSLLGAAVVPPVGAAPTPDLVATPAVSAGSRDQPRRTRVRAGGRDLEVEIGVGALDLPDQAVFDWVATAARAVSSFYGGFPVHGGRILVLPTRGRGVSGGTAYGYRTPFIRIHVGRETAASDLGEDWMMTHELVHFAFPSVPEQNHWIEEGVSTYVEPIARHRIGERSAEQVWWDLVTGLPNGLPGPGDRGLDFTSTWGRTYWGGALFCLLADIDIHQQTHNQRGLGDALRAILAAGGTITDDWDLPRALAIGDRATGVQVLKTLYEKMRASPAPVDLDRLWKQLGVERRGRRIVFDDDAPLAAVRRSITEGPAED